MARLEADLCHEQHALRENDLAGNACWKTADEARAYIAEHEDELRFELCEACSLWASVRPAGPWCRYSETTCRSHLPAHAVVENRAGRFVFVAEPDGDGLAAVRRRPVTVGAFALGGLEVLKGLAEGDRVSSRASTACRTATTCDSPPARPADMDLTRAAIEKNRITAVAPAARVRQRAVRQPRHVAGRGPRLHRPRSAGSDALPGRQPRADRAADHRPIEEAIQEPPAIDYLASTSKTGVSIVMVSVRDEFDDLQPIWSDLRHKVERAAGSLPDGVIDSRSTTSSATFSASSSRWTG